MSFDGDAVEINVTGSTPTLSMRSLKMNDWAITPMLPVMQVGSATM